MTMAPRRTDPTGRSTGKIVQLGYAKRWKLEGSWVPHLQRMRESAGWRYLSLASRRILDFLELEHMTHGGAENGKLFAPYAQLQASGISSRDIRPAIEMLEAFGFIRRTLSDDRLGRRPNAARYTLTWLPTHDGGMPTEDFTKVTQADVKAFLYDRDQAKRQKRRARA